MRRLASLALLLLLLAPTRARAGSPPTRTQILLLDCRTPAELRARLEAFADSSLAGDPFGSGDACAALGASFARASLQDSAIAWYARSCERRGDTEERLALADLLLDRRARGDVARATAQLRKNLEGVAALEARVPYQARLAWALHLAGRADSAETQFTEIESSLASSLEWCERMGRAALAAGRPGDALRWLSPVAIASRGQARQAMDTLAAAVAALPAGDPRRQAPAMIERRITALDRAEQRQLAALPARRVTFAAADGFPLGGTLVAPDDGARHVGALVLMKADESPNSCDSLVAVLRAANLAVLLIDRRGSGASVGPDCPLPYAWHGREEALERRCAGDVLSGLRALAGFTPIDTSRYVVVGIGETATTAVRAATLDPRVRALVLVSPSPHRVDRGVVRAEIGALQLPIFFQLAPEDFLLFDLTDVFYQAGNRPVSRVSDARGAGQGALQFRDDPAIAPRLSRWLDETLSAPTPPAPRPSRPRRE